MRRKVSLVAAGLLAGATLSTTVASPAHAQDGCTAHDPTLAYVCTVLNEADPVGWANYYYTLVGRVVTGVVCDLWECP
ncbi:MAG TPA: hypothetical protein VG318_11530 [Actinomycetota bacterium]|nr:hypothetical protein [Actinomycetota bacterium]